MKSGSSKVLDKQVKPLGLWDFVTNDPKQNKNSIQSAQHLLANA